MDSTIELTPEMRNALAEFKKRTGITYDDICQRVGRTRTRVRSWFDAKATHIHRGGWIALVSCMESAPNDCMRDILEALASASLRGAFCYEALPNGNLKLYVCPPSTDKTGDPVEVIIEHNDLPRLHAAIGDAMMGKASRR